MPNIRSKFPAFLMNPNNLCYSSCVFVWLSWLHQRKVEIELNK